MTTTNDVKKQFTDCITEIQYVIGQVMTAYTAANLQLSFIDGENILTTFNVTGIFLHDFTPDILKPVPLYKIKVSNEFFIIGLHSDKKIYIQSEKATAKLTPYIRIFCNY